MKTREEDFVSQLIIDSTHAYLLCFTNTGRVYWLKVYEIPDVGAAGKGKTMQSLLNLQPGENVRAILPVRDLEEEGKFIFFATRNGTVKKTPLKDFSNVMARGIIAIGIDKDDELISAGITDGKQIIFLATRDGMAIRFDEEYDPERNGIGLRPMGRNAAGNRGISLKKGDYVIGAAITDSDATRDKNATSAPPSSTSPRSSPSCAMPLERERALQKAREDQRAGAEGRRVSKLQRPRRRKTPSTTPRRHSKSLTRSSASASRSSSPSPKTASASAPTSTNTA